MASNQAVVTVAALGIVLVAVVGAGAMVLNDADTGGVSGPGDAAGTATPGSGVEAATVSVAESEVPNWVRSDTEASVTVTLSSDAPVSRLVSLYADGNGDRQLDTKLEERQVQVSGEQRVTLTLSGDALASGESYRLGVVIGDRTVMLGSAAVMEPPHLEIERADGGVAVVAGTTANVSATVRNDGDYAEQRTVRLQVDADGDGTFSAAESVAEVSVAPDAGETAQVTLAASTDSLAPGEYAYRVATDVGSETGTLTVQQPATMVVDALNTSTNVTRGTPASVVATVRNAGDVAGSGTVELEGPTGETLTAEVSLPAGATETVPFEIPTDDLARGEYDYTIASGGEEIEGNVTVREPAFEVSELRGNETLYIGDPMVFAANVTNVGDAAGTVTVEFRLDVDDDDVPEDDNITKRVTLAPGEERAVRFDVPYMEDPDPLNQVEDLPVGTYVYGIYAGDSQETGVFDARSQPVSFDVSAGGGSSDSGSDSGSLRASLDEIALEKYGLYYDEISAETQTQLDEIYERQPFAGNLGVTDVLTREEIARQEYGLDVKAGDNFDFTSIDIETQQQIEADFDAQFTSQTGDRIESWDELAQDRYGTTYESLDASQQDEIEQAYQAQFES